MMKNTTRAALAAALLLLLAACSQPTRVPTLSQVVGDTAALSSFAALVEALDMDLDAATQTGLFTVFAPSNDLLDAYAQSWGLEDAAELLATDLTEVQVAVGRDFVLAHVVLHMPGLLTEEFLTVDIADTPWYWAVETATMRTRIGSTPAGFIKGVQPLLAPISDGLALFFWGGSASGLESLSVDLVDIEFRASDVPFRSGIVHVIDATVLELDLGR